MSPSCAIPLIRPKASLVMLYCVLLALALCTVIAALPRADLSSASLSTRNGRISNLARYNYHLMTSPRLNMTSSRLKETDDPLHFEDCLAGSTGINVRIATIPPTLSARSMHGLLASAAVEIEKRLSIGGRRVDRPLNRDELPFEFEGTGRGRGYYLDIEQLPLGVLTLGKLATTIQGLTSCGLQRQKYSVLAFEIWEKVNGSGPRRQARQIGFGTLGALIPNELPPISSQ